MRKESRSPGGNVLWPVTSEARVPPLHDMNKSVSENYQKRSGLGTGKKTHAEQIILGRDRISEIHKKALCCLGGGEKRYAPLGERKKHLSTVGGVHKQDHMHY